MAIGAVFYGRYIKRLSLRTQRAMGDMVAFAEERLSAIRTVHAFNGANKEAKSYQGRVENIFELLKKEAFASACFFSTMQLSGNLTGVALLGFGRLRRCFPLSLSLSRDSRAHDARCRRLTRL